MNLQWSLSLQLLLAINLQSQTTWKSLQFLHLLMPHSYFNPPQFGLHSDAPMNTLPRSHCQPDCQIQQALLVPISLHPTVGSIDHSSILKFFSLNVYESNFLCLPSSEVWSIWSLPCFLSAFFNATVPQASVIYPLLTLIPSHRNLSHIHWRNGDSQIFIPTHALSWALEPDFKYPTKCVHFNNL